VLSPILNRQAGDPDGSPATEFTLDLHPSETTYAIRAYAAAGFAAAPPADRGAA
jgi:hypothetical protein